MKINITFHLQPSAGTLSIFVRAELLDATDRCCIWWQFSFSSVCCFLPQSSVWLYSSREWFCRLHVFCWSPDCRANWQRAWMWLTIWWNSPTWFPGWIRSSSAPSANTWTSQPTQVTSGAVCWGRCCLFFFLPPLPPLFVFLLFYLHLPCSCQRMGGCHNVLLCGREGQNSHNGQEDEVLHTQR